ncbi:hypothetical protein LBMAG26_06410 [Bacteroidota bacterium]|nr:hypothetical protein LBMAG26_06410 [Bacteroidota bacterium]
MQNAFDFFGLTPSLSLDAKEIRKRYIEIQRQAHPDLIGVDNIEINSVELANRYYEELHTPRGVVKSYLMAMNVSDLNQNRLPKDFLFEMMGLNDEIDEKHSGNAAAGEKAEGLLDRADLELTGALNLLKENPSPDLDELVEWYQKSKYLDRLRKNFLGIEEI